MNVSVYLSRLFFVVVSLGGLALAACGGSEDPPVPAGKKAEPPATVPVVVAEEPPREHRLPVPGEAVGWGQLTPADFAAAAGIWTGEAQAKMPAKPVGVALFVTGDGALDIAFFAPKSAPVGGSHTRCHPVGASCWYTRPGRELGREVAERSHTSAGSFLTVSLAHPAAAAFVEARPLLQQLEIGELTLRVTSGRVEAEVRPREKKLAQTLVDAAHYWLMLAINERETFLRSPSVGIKFFDALPGATLGVKKNTIHFAMAGDCSMLAWSLLAMHQLYPYLHP
jgi:hypothetical protein